MKSFSAMALFAFIVALVDQVTKYYAVLVLSTKEIVIIPDFFSLVLAYNRGAAFGFMSGLPDGIRQLALGIATAAAIGAVIYMWFHYHKSSFFGGLSVGLILGGAIGNIIDRVRLGMVVDFLDVYVGSYHWPTFNVADSCICVGVAILVFLKNDLKEPLIKPNEA
jgi:signal peptidase II